MCFSDLSLSPSLIFPALGCLLNWEHFFSSLLYCLFIGNTAHMILLPTSLVFPTFQALNPWSQTGFFSLSNLSRWSFSFHLYCCHQSPARSIGSLNKTSCFSSISEFKSSRQLNVFVIGVILCAWGYRDTKQEISWLLQLKFWWYFY